MAEKPSIPKGTRDFSPVQMVKRNYIFDTIRSVFQLYGFLPIETPAMENLSTLMGKYGEEGDKLIFKILNSGNYFQDASLHKEQIHQAELFMGNISGNTVPLDHIVNHQALAPKIAEKALRYDLTVPFARYVVQHRNEITFPFKRYQIQPVWRADRPQKGRYREFFQCDADVIGSDSLLNELELIQIMTEVFKKLGIKAVIKINNRKILSGIAEIIGAPDKIVDITVAIDKLDKIGIQKVNDELAEKGLSIEQIEKIQPLVQLSGDNTSRLNFLKNFLSSSSIGQKGIEEIEYIFNKLGLLFSGEDMLELEFDVTLARGLNYYTGAIFEVKANDSRSDFKSSICGGGRYDDLTGIFGLPNVSGVGISFGADRIYDVMEDIGLFPDSSGETTRILFVNFGEPEENYCLPLVEKLRKMSINAEIYPENAKMKKQMAYADSKKIPFVALIGPDEVCSGLLTVKNMQTGAQVKLSFNQLLNLLSEK
jgi:histidyl-tRNA synthetase